MNFKATQEWFFQAEYDISTADAMYSTGRYIYSVFMVHLAIEKTLKGLWAKKYQEDAPRTHNLEYLRERLSIDIPNKSLHETLLRLNKVCIPIRYPDDLQKLSKDFTPEITLSILNNSKVLLEWLKQQ